MPNTLTNLFLEYAGKKVFDRSIFFTKEDDEYSAVNLGELSKRIFNVIQFLNDTGLKEGDRVAIISENRVEWVITDIACMFLKLITIPVYTSLSDEQVKYIVNDSESKVCFVSNSLQLEKILKIKNEIQTPEKIVVYNDLDHSKYLDESIIFFSNISEAETPSAQDIVSRLKQFSTRVNDDDILTIIYTSGTTGIPKGVMLMHKNICSNVNACRKVLLINESDTFLSFLPYSHAYERTAGYYLAFFSGAKIYYAQSIDTIGKQLTEANPTIVITVPRLLDKIYARLIKSGNDMEEGIRKKIFGWAIELASCSADKNSLKWKIADMLVYKKIRAKTGTRLRFFVSGGGALNKSVGKFFDNIGIAVLEGYGLTEASPVVSVNPPEKNKYGTVGKPLSNVKVKIADDNEILVSGDLVMKGYYKDDQATHDIIKDNWLYTGDLGEIDNEGYIKITDRKKSLIKTSGGKYVAPAFIEDLVSSLNYVENVMIIGNGRMYVTALIVPERNEIIQLAERNGINSETYSELLHSNALHKIISKDIDRIQKDIAHHERVRRFALIEKPFSIEAGELTPTLKVKRKVVEEKYKDIIEAMYLKV